MFRQQDIFREDEKINGTKRCFILSNRVSFAYLLCNMVECLDSPLHWKWPWFEGG